MDRNMLIMKIVEKSLDFAKDSSDGGDPEAFVDMLRVLLTSPTDELEEAYNGLTKFGEDYPV